MTKKISADSVGTESLFAARYRAVQAKDARFDGQFIMGVSSTKIYCRPSCPAKTPSRKNVSFFLTAAAAQSEGLRACKRCLPDAAPGSPEWNIRDTLASRAMRLIGDGVVDREGVDALGKRLGYSTRHLNRMMVAELGAGAQQLAKAHRAQTARKLLIETDLPITKLAFASGFSSIRQFNETIRTVYQMTPSQLRNLAARNSSAGKTQENGVIKIVLPAREPFDGIGLLKFLAARSISGIEKTTENEYLRSMRLPSGHAVISAKPRATDLHCTIWCESLADLVPIVSRVRRLFDLDADANTIDQALSRIPELHSHIMENPGIRIPGTVDGEEILFRALVGQQISVRAARKILSDLTQELGDQLAVGEGTVTLLFPTAEKIATHGKHFLRGPARRIDTIMRVAEMLASGTLTMSMADSVQQLTEKLQAIPGIGSWTAGYVAMRVVGAPDILLHGDLALRKGASLCGLPSSSVKLAQYGHHFSPWRSYAGMHLWRIASSVEGAKK